MVTDPKLVDQLIKCNKALKRSQRKINRACNSVSDPTLEKVVCQLTELIDDVSSRINKISEEQAGVISTDKGKEAEPLTAAEKKRRKSERRFKARMEACRDVYRYSQVIVPPD